MNRIFVREEAEELYAAKKSRQKIGIVGMSAGAGTSFISSSLAKHLSKEKGQRVAFVEACTDSSSERYIYDSLGMDKRFAGRAFYDFYHEMKEGRSVSGLVNLDEKINWALRVPSMTGQYRDNIKIEPIEMCRIINNITADIIVCDLTTSHDTEEIIREMDLIIFVIDPLPSKLISGYPSLCQMKNLEMKGQKIIWLVNKYNEGVNKREFNTFIKVKNYIIVPMVQQQSFYLAEYNCRIPYSVKSIAEVMTEPLEKIKLQIEF
ncbi:hypothetical protein [Clostridium aminobutyricum]|uniref:Uncharacterized protein n=1 Tax=Clostridium aminobutyricum TaxID=33953 RepID=A0A939D7I5_CLOAM|nr:hypothetical protein [Clostridium aminobutyricum]MBN7772879.1 hypothetical protein [Clostridium aminobutyricum]